MEQNAKYSNHNIEVFIHLDKFFNFHSYSFHTTLSSANRLFFYSLEFRKY